MTTVTGTTVATLFTTSIILLRQTLTHRAIAGVTATATLLILIFMAVPGIPGISHTAQWCITKTQQFIMEAPVLRT